MADVMSLFSPSLTVSPSSPCSTSGPPSLSIDEDDYEQATQASLRLMKEYKTQSSSELSVHGSQEPNKRSISYSPPRTLTGLKLAQLSRHPLPQV